VQRKVDDKSREITTIPKLLNALELAATVVTIDAMPRRTEPHSGILRQVGQEQEDAH